MWRRSCAAAFFTPTPTLVGILPPRAAPCAAGFALAVGGFCGRLRSRCSLRGAERALPFDDQRCCRFLAISGRIASISIIPLQPRPCVAPIVLAWGCARPSRRTARGLPLGGFACVVRLSSVVPATAGPLRLLPPPPAPIARSNQEGKTSNHRQMTSQPAGDVAAGSLAGSPGWCASLVFLFAAWLWPAAAGLVFFAAWLPACRLKNRVVGAQQFRGTLMPGLECLQSWKRTGAYRHTATISRRRSEFGMMPMGSKPYFSRTERP
jgi:hypothetical protein